MCVCEGTHTHECTVTHMCIHGTGGGKGVPRKTLTDSVGDTWIPVKPT